MASLKRRHVARPCERMSIEPRIESAIRIAIVHHTPIAWPTWMITNSSAIGTTMKSRTSGSSMGRTHTLRQPALAAGERAAPMIEVTAERSDRTHAPDALWPLVSDPARLPDVVHVRRARRGARRRARRARASGVASTATGASAAPRSTSVITRWEPQQRARVAARGGAPERQARPALRGVDRLHASSWRPTAPARASACAPRRCRPGRCAASSIRAFGRREVATALNDSLERLAAATS